MIDEAMLLREAAYDILERDPQETKAVMQAAASKIDELRSMLAERDVEITKLKTVPMMYRRMKFNAELQDEVMAQRKVLEQALSALTPHKCTCATCSAINAANDAIREILK